MSKLHHLHAICEHDTHTEEGIWMGVILQSTTLKTTALKRVDHWKTGPVGGGHNELR